jgi:hypothetical protein
MVWGPEQAHAAHSAHTRSQHSVCVGPRSVHACVGGGDGSAVFPPSAGASACPYLRCGGDVVALAPTATPAPQQPPAYGVEVCVCGGGGGRRGEDGQGPAPWVLSVGACPSVRALSRTPAAAWTAHLGSAVCHGSAVHSLQQGNPGEAPPAHACTHMCAHMFTPRTRRTHHAHTRAAPSCACARGSCRNPASHARMPTQPAWSACFSACLRSLGCVRVCVTQGLERVLCNDLDPAAVESIRKNAELNGVSPDVLIPNQGAASVGVVYVCVSMCSF